MARPGAARTIGARRLRLPRQSFPTRCPLLALSGHFGRTSQCLLLGIKRTWRLRCEMSANDPKRTSSIPIGRCIRLASRVNIVSLLPFGCFLPGRISARLLLFQFVGRSSRIATISTQFHELGAPPNTGIDAADLYFRQTVAYPCGSRNSSPRRSVLLEWIIPPLGGPSSALSG
jgi:hypothetical protein